MVIIKMSYSISNTASVPGLSASTQSSLAQGLANNTRVIAPPASTEQQSVAATARVRQGIDGRDLAAMALGTSLTVNSDALVNIQLQNALATTFVGGGNIIRYNNCSVTRETNLGTAGTNPLATDPGGQTINAFFGDAALQPWQADFTEVVPGTIVTTPGVFTASTVANRNIWDPTMQFSVAAQPGGSTYKVTTANPVDGIDYVNVQNGTANVGGGAADTITTTANPLAGVVTLPVGAAATAYLGRQLLGMIIDGAQAADSLQMSTAAGALGTPFVVPAGPVPSAQLNAAPSGIYVSAADATTVTLSTVGDAPITFTNTGGGNITLTLIMGARFAVCDAQGNDVAPSAPLVNDEITFLNNQAATAHYLDFGLDTAANARELHDYIFGNSHNRTESKSQLLSLSQLSANSNVDLFVGTSTQNPTTGVISPAAADSAGTHVVFLTDLSQAIAASDGTGNGRNANVQVIDDQETSMFEVKLLAEWLTDDSTTQGAAAGTFPRMQFTRVQAGMVPAA